jgi:Zn finger protein HypA/HybF involved in hydrogenase expression
MKIVERVCIDCKKVFLGKETQFLCERCQKKAPPEIQKKELELAKYEADLNEI